uniref:Response regulator receiver domain n=1 Tax=uncultured sulfate-reducing bacterium TaxID=153939 RepID=Q3IBP2_9BACT|nr:Response regulator receiver domain [uncultured sulfate-reducing bacterium]
MEGCTLAKKILIVDDESDIRTYLEVLFEENGYETAVAKDGDEAMSKVREFKPDLITLDIIMPRETGQKFYRALVKDAKFSKTPVIICSGVTRYKELFSRDHKTMPKPFAFVEKPIDKEELLGKVREATR